MTAPLHQKMNKTYIRLRWGQDSGKSQIILDNGQLIKSCL